MAIIPSPFLTDIDPQVAVKGSRDPLGIQTIWARLGRHVVGNLTTVTSSVGEFKTLLLGYYFAERISDAGNSDEDLNVFLRWEQLAAHARFYVNPLARIRGIERVKKTKNEGGIILLCADSSGQILSDQKTYGLWGLYTGPARASGLVEGDPTRLSAAGRRLVEEVYLPTFANNGLRNANSVVTRLTKPKEKLDAKGRDALFLRSIGKTLEASLAPLERELFRDHLLLGIRPDNTGARQSAVAEAIRQTLDVDGWTWTPTHISHLAKSCRTLGLPGNMAADRLERIRIAEQILAPAAALFYLVLASNGQTLSEVVESVKQAWGAQMPTIDPIAAGGMEAEFRDSSGNVDAGRRWVRVAEALAAGGYERAINLLMEQNAFVMKTRAGAGAWVDLAEGRLRVRYQEEASNGLPERQDLPNLWKNSYFLDALRSIAMELQP